MSGKSQSMRALGNLLTFEMRRLMTPARLLTALIAIIVMSVLARDNLLQQASMVSSQMANKADRLAGLAVNLTAFDMSYLALNNQMIAGVILPISCGLLCADLIVRDRASNMRTMISCEMGSDIAYVSAKLAAALLMCFFLVLCFVFTCTAVSWACMGLPLSSAVPEWLAAADPQDSIWGSYGRIPDQWNYVAVICFLIGGFGLLETVLAWGAMALCSFLRTPSAASLMTVGCYVVISQIESLVTSLGVHLGIESLTTTVGWVTDRLCLINYRLGADFFQNSAGGSYRGPMVLPEEIAMREHPINSWASLVLVMLVVALLSVTVLVLRERHLKSMDGGDMGVNDPASSGLVGAYVPKHRS